LLTKLHMTGYPALAAAIVLSLAISFPVAALVHRFVEKPLMNLFKKKGREKSKIEIRKSKSWRRLWYLWCRWW